MKHSPLVTAHPDEHRATFPVTVCGRAGPQMLAMLSVGRVIGDVVEAEFKACPTATWDHVVVHHPKNPPLVATFNEGVLRSVYGQDLIVTIDLPKWGR
jgi:hypothetical protein